MWYKTDFGSTDRECLRYLKSSFFVKKCKFGVYTLCNFQFLFFSLCDKFSWISHHLGKDEQQKLKSLLEVADSDSSINITYSEYNWNLNGSKL